MKHMTKRALALLLALVTVLAVFPVMTSTAAAVEASAVPAIESYEDIYVTSGLTVWLNGFDRDNIDLAAKTWKSEVGSVVATLGGTWKNGTLNAANTSSGIRYDLGGCDGNFYIDLGISNLPVGNFTLETVAEAIGLTVDGNGTDPYLYAAQYGPGATAFYVGPLKLEGFPFQRDPAGDFATVAENANNQLAAYYIAGTQGWNPTGGSLVNYASGMRTHVYDRTGEAATMTVEHSLYAEASSNYRVITNGARAFDFSVPGKFAEKISYIPVAADQKFQVFRAFPAEVYSVRVYDRVLTDAEIARNHFADLCGYYGADVSALTGMNASERQVVYNAFATVKYGETDKAALEAAIAAQTVKITETAYDKAYVQDGLVLLLTAFGENSSVNLDNGVWYGKLGTGYGVLHGDKFNAETATHGWKLREDGSVGYDLNNGQLSSAAAKNMYLDLKYAMSNSQVNYTAEYVADYENAYDKLNHNTLIVTEKFGYWGGWLHGTNALDMLYTAHSYTHGWGDGNGHLPAPNGNFWTGPIAFWGDVTNTVTYAVAQTDTTASRTFYANAKSYYTQSAPGVKDAKGTEMTKKLDNNEGFFMAHNTTCDLYAVRIYNRTLTDAEVAQNHFVDMAAYCGFDLSELDVLSDDQRAALYASCKNATVDQATVGAIYNAINALVGYSMDAYDALYVQNGLVFLATSYSTATTSADILGGKWHNKVANTADYATLYDTTSAASWAYAKNGKGIEYGFNSIGDLVGNLYNIGMQLPTGAFTDGDMAAEYVFAVNPTLDADGNQVKIGYTKTPIVDGEGNPVLDDKGNPTYTESFSHGGKWGVYNGSTRSNFSFGGLNICHFVLTDNPHGASMEDRVFYAPGPWEAGWGTTDEKGNDQRRFESTKLFGTASGWNTDIITLGFNRDVTARPDTYSQADFTILINGAQKVTTSNVKHPNSANQSKFYTVSDLNGWTVKGAAGTAADAFFGVPATVYAVRVYNRALTDAERAQNYAVDLLAYFEIDITGIETLSLDEQAALVNELSRFSMNKGGKSEIQTIVSNAVAKAVPTAADMSAYDELYVTEDLVALFTAFDAKGSGIDLAAGTWTDKKSGLTVTLDDRTGAAEWNLGQNGMGVGYWFQSLKDLADSRYAIGMRLPTSVLTNGDLSVEYTFKANPVENPDGTQARIIKLSGTQAEQNVITNIGGLNYGLYNGGNSSFTFAGLQLCQFQWDNYDGASMTARAFYSNGSWGSMNSGDFTQPYLFGTKADGYSSDVAVLSIDRTVTEKTGEGEYNEASFVIYKNGASQTTVKNGGTHAKQKAFYTIEELNASQSGSTAADAFYGVPATVYAIRIYTDDLTAAEKAQNYAVDLMAYFGLDVDGFSAASAAAKTAVYEAFASYTFNATAEEVAAMQTAIDAAVAGIPVAEGFQVAKDGKALRIWASIDGFENVSKLGMTITFKQNGEVIYSGNGETTTAFLSVTAGDTMITAEELGAAGLYAASVSGFAEGTYTVEITPYVVLLDDTTVTGETESATVTFTFAE